MADLYDMIFGTSDVVLLFILFGILLVGIGAIIFLIVQLRKYRNRLIIRNIASDRKFIEIEKFRVFKDNEGVVWWKLLKRKQLIPVAPSEAIEISKKGAIIAEAYYTDEGEFVYQTDKVSSMHFDDIHGAVYVTDEVRKVKFDEVLDEYKQKLIEYEKLPFNKRIFAKKPKRPKEPDDLGRYVYIKDKNKTIEGFQPFTTKQRLILVNQYKKAQSKKKIDWAANMPAIVSVVSLVMILLVLFMFWEDITRPSLEAMDTMNSITEKQLEITERLQEIIQQKQILSDSGGAKGDPPS